MPDVQLNYFKTTGVSLQHRNVSLFATAQELWPPQECDLHEGYFGVYFTLTLWTGLCVSDFFLANSRTHAMRTESFVENNKDLNMLHVSTVYFINTYFQSFTVIMPKRIYLVHQYIQSTILSVLNFTDPIQNGNSPSRIFMKEMFLIRFEGVIMFKIERFRSTRAKICKKN